jgi:redox-sensitive bicupin YhaK (pirin superfamily)
MSNLEPDPSESRCGGSVSVAAKPVADLVAARDVPLGRYTTVQRFLPHRERRMVGAWCFLDRYGPQSVIALPGMRVPPHPHTGLQTVSWLFDGEIVHRDSLGSLQTIRPGQLNLMTSGYGIAHSEESPREHPPNLHGLQLWVALPDQARHGGPRFDHYPDLPVLRASGIAVTVVAGELDGVRSPALTYSPLVGAEIVLEPGAQIRLPLERDFEYAVLVIDGSAEVAGCRLGPEALLYLGTGRSDLMLDAAGATRLFLLGGAPFEEDLVMWWNFVARTHEEVVAAREDWAAGRRFGVVHGYDGDPLPAPPLPTARLKSRDRHGHSRQRP